MKSLVRMTMALLAVLALAWAVHWAGARFGKGFVASTAPGAVLRGPGTVISVTGTATGKNAGGTPARARVCFSIDSFAEIGEEMREFYEIHERARATANGPLCGNATLPAGTPTPEAGDHVDVYFRLQEGGGIEPLKLRRRGVDLELQ